MDDLTPLLDVEDALEAKLRLGVLASSVLDAANILCTDVGLLSLGGAGRVMKTYAEDFQTLASAIEVLERRAKVVTGQR